MAPSADGAAVQSNASIIAVNNWAAGASYTALAITNRPSGNLLYAANLPNNVVEVYDANFNLVNTFTDPRWGRLMGHSASRISTDWSM